MVKYSPRRRQRSPVEETVTSHREHMAHGVRYRPVRSTQANVHFANPYVNPLKRRLSPGYTAGLISVSAVALGFLLLSGNITGNVIYNLQRSDANVTGLILIFLGILGLVFCTRRK